VSHDFIDASDTHVGVPVEANAVYVLNEAGEIK
jgi:hypothetical protein